MFKWLIKQYMLREDVIKIVFLGTYKRAQIKKLKKLNHSKDTLTHSNRYFTPYDMCTSEKIVPLYQMIFL